MSALRAALLAPLVAAALALGCSEAAPPPDAETAAPEEAPDPALTALAQQAAALFPALPAVAENPANPQSDAKVALGRTLYHDARLSKNQDVSCNSCHQLAAHGVDGEATSPGHRGQRGDRNSPTVYNAALHIAQFWDGRAADVEEQAKGPILNPIEMAMPSEDAVLVVVNSIPGYADLFAAAFPDDANPVTYDNLGRAIGAFERTLLTPAPVDAFAAGELDALTPAQVRGLETFVKTGCPTCHMGPAIGGGMYRKLGLVHPYSTEDLGRANVTGEEADRFVFKVPSLRNVAETGPWFHDGSITDLGTAVRKMAHHQLGMKLSDAQVADVVSFLGALTGELDPAVTTAPVLPVSGPTTPAPDPS